jgi:plasmid stabilization system protein ParE
MTDYVSRARRGWQLAHFGLLLTERRSAATATVGLIVDTYGHPDAAVARRRHREVVAATWSIGDPRTTGRSHPERSRRGRRALHWGTATARRSEARHNHRSYAARRPSHIDRPTAF